MSKVRTLIPPHARALSKGAWNQGRVSVCKMWDGGRLPAESVVVDIVEPRESVAGSSSGSMEQQKGE